MDATRTTLKNFRDMGALKCEGGSIKRGMLFRAPALRAKTRANRRFLDSLGLEAIIDLRTPEEAAEKPDYIPSGCEYVDAPVYGSGMFELITSTKSGMKQVFALKGAGANALRENKLRLYAYMPFAASAFAAIFKRMDSRERIAFHCSEGKDRTGVAAALIELAFGRKEAEIREEYMRSNAAFAGRNRRQNALLALACADANLRQNIKYCECTHDELFDAARGAIFEKYSSIADFLRAEHGITPERIAAWREFYIEPGGNRAGR